VLMIMTNDVLMIMIMKCYQTLIQMNSKWTEMNSFKSTTGDTKELKSPFSDYLSIRNDAHEPVDMNTSDKTRKTSGRVGIATKLALVVILWHTCYSQGVYHTLYHPHFDVSYAFSVFFVFYHNFTIPSHCSSVRPPPMSQMPCLGIN